MEGIITAIQPQERRAGRRVNVFVDGRYAFSLQSDLADMLRVGQPISDLRTADLLLEDEHARAFEAALVFLSYRPRSEAEVHDRLRKKGFPDSILKSVLDRLKRLKLVNDEDFARYWVEQRQTHRPRGSRMLRQELRRRGIPAEMTGEVLAEAVAEEDPAESAYRAACRKAGTLRLLDEREFKQKLGQFLVRRGFDFDAARAATRRLWEELGSPS